MPPSEPDYELSSSLSSSSFSVIWLLIMPSIFGFGGGLAYSMLDEILLFGSGFAEQGCFTSSFCLDFLSS